MKKAKGKKLSLQKLSIAKLDNMSMIKAGLYKSREPNCNQIFHIYTKNCITNAKNCTSPTVNCTSPTVIGT